MEIFNFIAATITIPLVGLLIYAVSGIPEKRLREKRLARERDEQKADINERFDKASEIKSKLEHIFLNWESELIKFIPELEEESDIEIFKFNIIDPSLLLEFDEPNYVHYGTALISNGKLYVSNLKSNNLPYIDYGFQALDEKSHYKNIQSASNALKTLKNKVWKYEEFDLTKKMSCEYSENTIEVSNNSEVGLGTINAKQSNVHYGVGIGNIGIGSSRGVIQGNIEIHNEGSGLTRTLVESATISLNSEKGQFLITIPFWDASNSHMKNIIFDSEMWEQSGDFIEEVNNEIEKIRGTAKRLIKEISKYDDSGMAVDYYTKDCPFCGEEILSKAIKCKHCHSMLNLT